MNRFSWKHIALKVSFSRNILHAGAVKGLIIIVMATTAVTIYQRLLDHQRCFSPASSVDGNDDDAGDHQRNKDVHDGALQVVVVVRMLLFH